MNEKINKLAIISATMMLFLLTACSNTYKKPLPSSGVTAKKVGSESYESFKSAYDELKTAFFTKREK